MQKMTLKCRIENGIVYSPYHSEPVPEMSLYQVLKQFLVEYGDRTAVVSDEEDITFAELLKMFQRYAAGFQGHGIKKGVKVLVHLNDSLESMIAMYSVVFAGGVVVTSNPIFSDEDILYRIVNGNTTYILTTASEATRLSAICFDLNIKGYFTIGVAPGFVSVTAFKNLDESTFQEVKVDNVKDEGVGLFYTSGTTGRPKGIELTHYSIVAGLPRARSYNYLADHEVIASRKSMTLSVGFRTYFHAFASGSKIILLLTTDTETILNAIRKHKATMLIGDISMLMALARKIDEECVRLESLKNVKMCGIKVTPEMLMQLKPSFDLSIIKNGYGSTETGGICSPPTGDSTCEGIGFPEPMVQIKIVDTNTGEVLGPNEKGEALVKTPTSMKGYYGDPEATSRVMTADGWVRTGDICYYNQDGLFFFVERINQFFRCMQIHVAPSDVESILMRHEGIAEVAVIGVPHPQYQQVAKAFLVLKVTHCKVTEAEIKTFVADQLPAYMHLHGGVKIVDALPKHDNGKVNINKLVEIYQEDSHHSTWSSM